MSEFTNNHLKKFIRISIIKHYVIFLFMSYDDPSEPKMYNLVKQLLKPLRNKEMTVVLDSRFFSVQLFDIALEFWKIRLVGSFAGNSIWDIFLPNEGHQNAYLDVAVSMKVVRSLYSWVPDCVRGRDTTLMTWLKKRRRGQFITIHSSTLNITLYKDAAVMRIVDNNIDPDWMKHFY